jgi:hypothetical protein
MPALSNAERVQDLLISGAIARSSWNRSTFVDLHQSNEILNQVQNDSVEDWYNFEN